MELVIVESPTKAKTIGQYLGPEFTVLSSYGHVRDLPKSELGIDVDHDFEPGYIVPTKAKKNLALLKKEAKKADGVILATDGDREGEAIAWHLAQALGLQKKKKGKRGVALKQSGEGKHSDEEEKPIKRIEFHEITKAAIAKALEHPRQIDQALVDAQQARRVLDRLVGYKISPVLWKRYWRGLSAGRVQSVAVRLIVDREREIEKFKPDEYWSITATLFAAQKGAAAPALSADNSPIPVIAQLNTINGKTIEKLEVATRGRSQEIVDDLAGADYKVSSVERAQSTRMPHAPFTTSTLQQDASKRLHFSSKQTMMLAQQLYEAGFITYMRTDSVNLSEESMAKAKEFIDSSFGASYYNRRKFKNKSKNAQEAHEAIRPSDPLRKLEDIAGSLTPQQGKLYDLIWRRFMASQMAVAVFDATTIDIAAKTYGFRANGSVLKFDGWLKVLPSKFEDLELPQVTNGQTLELKELKPEQHFTKPPPRFNEASLIKTLEKEGIGRPSTYSAIISTIVTRKYVEKDRSRIFRPTEIGGQVNDFLVENFPRIVDIAFTSHMEDELDEIAAGKRQWVPTVREFYTPLAKDIAIKSKEASAAKESEVETTDKICDKCGSPMIVKRGRFGKFIACSNFPTCKNIFKEPKSTAPLEKVGRPCPTDGGELIFRVSRFGKFIACTNFPKCKYTEKIKKEKTPETADATEGTEPKEVDDETPDETEEAAS